MNTVFTIAQTEARRIFVSPLAWAVLAVMQLIFGFVFINMLVDYARNAAMSGQFMGVADYIGGGLYGFATIILLLVMPLLTMRMFAEERKSGTLILLLSAPASLIEIVLGKFLGLFAFMLATIALLGLMPLTLLSGTHLDLGRIAAGLLGLLLMMMAFGAAGLFVSTLTKEPTIAAVASFGLLLLVWLIQIVGNQPIPFASVFSYLSLIGHFESLRRGIFNSADVIYYFLFTAFFLWLAVLRLDMERN
ncbi:MAG: transporter permease [Nevskia sp.]|nr:transporter permease [Nevskia sp.]